jgi:hypothetical protein
MHLFDPGKLNNPSCYYLLNMLVPQIHTLPCMHKTGNVIIHDNSYIIDECLFDTGASDNFIAQSFIDKNVDIFAEYISSHNSSIDLAMNKSLIDVNMLNEYIIVEYLVHFIDYLRLLHLSNAQLRQVFDPGKQLFSNSSPTLPSLLHVT